MKKLYLIILAFVLTFSLIPLSSCSSSKDKYANPIIINSEDVFNNYRIKALYSTTNITDKLYYIDITINSDLWNKLTSDKQKILLDKSLVDTGLDITSINIHYGSGGAHFIKGAYITVE